MAASNAEDPSQSRSELRQAQQAHRALHQRVGSLRLRDHDTPEARELKKRKLRAKDKMAALGGQAAVH